MADDDCPTEATDLRFVGPATAKVIDEADFDATDIAAGRVSYRQLDDAGVNPGVAERLRREYSLVWTFEWVADGDLARRAARLRDVDEAERRWFAGEDADRVASVAEAAGDEALPSLADREWPAVDPESDDIDLVADDAQESVCPRCGAGLATYSLEGNESVMCEQCGYAGVTAELSTRGRPAWEAAVERLLRGEHLP